MVMPGAIEIQYNFLRIMIDSVAWPCGLAVVWFVAAEWLPLAKAGAAPELSAAEWLLRATKKAIRRSPFALCPVFSRGGAVRRCGLPVAGGSSVDRPGRSSGRR